MPTPSARRRSPGSSRCLLRRRQPAMWAERGSSRRFRPRLHSKRWDGLVVLHKSQEQGAARPITFQLVRVLVVEDERKLARIVESALQTEHYDVVVAPTGEDGFFRANAEVFDLIILDLMLPGRGGL